MGFSLVLATLLCFTTWMTSVDTTHGPVGNCCMVWSTTKVELQRIVNYTIQPEGICPITAIVFLTKHGNRVCSNPNTRWAKRAKKKVDEETKALLVSRQNEEGSTSDIITPASASMKAPQNKGRNGNSKWRWVRCRKRKSWKGRKGGKRA